MSNHGQETHVQVTLSRRGHMNFHSSRTKKQINAPVGYIGDGGGGFRGADTARWANLFPGPRCHHAALGSVEASDLLLCDAFWNIYLAVTVLDQTQKLIAVKQPRIILVLDLEHKMDPLCNHDVLVKAQQLEESLMQMKFFSVYLHLWGSNPGLCACPVTILSWNYTPRPMDTASLENGHSQYVHPSQFWMEETGT